MDSTNGRFQTHEVQGCFNTALRAQPDTCIRACSAARVFSIYRDFLNDRHILQSSPGLLYTTIPLYI